MAHNLFRQLDDDILKTVVDVLDEHAEARQKSLAEAQQLRETAADDLAKALAIVAKFDTSTGNPNDQARNAISHVREFSQYVAKDLDNREAGQVILDSITAHAEDMSESYSDAAQDLVNTLKKSGYIILNYAEHTRKYSQTAWEAIYWSQIAAKL